MKRSGQFIITLYVIDDLVIIAADLRNSEAECVDPIAEISGVQKDDYCRDQQGKQRDQ